MKALLFSMGRAPVLLAPMAGVTDLVFRRICRSFGADGAVSEMVSAKALCFGDRKSRKLCEIDDLERPTGIQLFGHEPHTLAQAAQIVCAFSPDWIDLNMGCPVHKVVSSGDGSALMRDPELIFRIVQAVTQAVELPVTAYAQPLPPRRLPPREAALGQISMGRYGSVPDVAKLAAFLASDDASYITGQVIGVDGGIIM